MSPETARSVHLVMASANPHKAAEIEAVLGPAFRISPRPAHLAEVVEDAPDLLGNARLKALAVCEATGLAAVADDTGLEVDALGGAPGVRSARFAGDPADDAANVALLVERLTGVTDRRARFRTVALVREPGGVELRADGVVEGTIAGAPRGDGGFGYDPVFIPDEGDGRTFAEMTREEKAALSHRGRAFRALALQLTATRSP